MQWLLSQKNHHWREYSSELLSPPHSQASRRWTHTSISTTHHHWIQYWFCQWSTRRWSHALWVIVISILSTCLLVIHILSTSAAWIFPPRVVPTRLFNALYKVTDCYRHFFLFGAIFPPIFTVDVSLCLFFFRTMTLVFVVRTS